MGVFFPWSCLLVPNYAKYNLFQDLPLYDCLVYYAWDVSKHLYNLALTSLEKSGIIQSYNAEFDLSKLGHDVLVLVRITLQGQSAAMMSEFEEAAKQIPQILACFLIAGEEDYLLRIAAKDVTDFGKIHANYLSALPNVLRMESNFVLRPVFNRGLDANTF